MLYDYGIELCGNLREIPVQIKRLHTDLVATHLVAVVRLNGLIRCGIKEHAGNLVGLVPELCILVLDVGKDLIQIAGMKRVDVVLSGNKKRKPKSPVIPTVFRFRPPVLITL